MVDVKQIFPGKNMFNNIGRLKLISLKFEKINQYLDKMYIRCITSS